MFDFDSGDVRDARREAKLRVLGTRTPRCTGCTETDPAALTLEGGRIWCYECRSGQTGRPVVEQQHPAGRHNHPATVPLLGNDHRAIDDCKNDWPRDTLRNPDASPLLRAAACLRGWIDTLLVIIERTVGWIAPWLEALDIWLREQLGPGWWRNAPAPEQS